MNRTHLGLVVATTLSLTACGKEIGRASLAQEGSTEAKVTVKANKPVAVWVSLDWDFVEPLEARYDVELVQNASVVASAKCNPLDVSVKTMSKELSINGKRSIKYNGKMRDCELKAPADGEATLKARLVFPKKSGTPMVRDASILLKE